MRDKRGRVAERQRGRGRRLEGATGQALGGGGGEGLRCLMLVASGVSCLWRRYCVGAAGLRSRRPARPAAKDPAPGPGHAVDAPLDLPVVPLLLPPGAGEKLL